MQKNENDTEMNNIIYYFHLLEYIRYWYIHAVPYTGFDHYK